MKETDQRFIDRRVEVERLLSDRQLPLDLLVYTPRELRDLFAAGSPFIEQVIESGRVLYMRKNEKNDGGTASILFEYRKYRGVCLHSPQCVEKGLKALVLEKGRRPADSRCRGASEHGCR